MAKGGTPHFGSQRGQRTCSVSSFHSLVKGWMLKTTGTLPFRGNRGDQGQHVGGQSIFDAWTTLAGPHATPSKSVRSFGREGVSVPRSAQFVQGQ